MSTVIVRISKKGLRKETAEKIVANLPAVKEILGEGISSSTEWIPESRAERLYEVLGVLQDAKDSAQSEVESLRDELEGWKSNLDRTGFEGGDKYSQLEA